MVEAREKKGDGPNQLSRRKFIGGITASSIAVTLFGSSAYQIWKTGTDFWEGSISKLAVAASNGYIIFDPALCTGCQSCEVVCTTFNYGESNNSLARIQVLRDPFKAGIENFNPTPCLQCESPHCLPVCPVAALKIDYASGTNARVIDETECIGCKKCLEACSAKHSVDRIRFNEKISTASKCHLCYGEPKCVKYCSNGALRYFTKKPGDGTIQQNNQTIFIDERANDIPRRILKRV